SPPTAPGPPAGDRCQPRSAQTQALGRFDLPPPTLVERLLALLPRGVDGAYWPFSVLSSQVVNDLVFQNPDEPSALCGSPGEVLLGTKRSQEGFLHQVLGNGS